MTTALGTLNADLAVLTAAQLPDAWRAVALRALQEADVEIAAAGGSPSNLDASSFANGGFSVGVGYPGVVLAYRIPITNLAGDYSITVPAGITFAFVDAMFQKTGGAGGAGDSFALKFAGTNVTVDGNVADNAIVRVASFDDTWSTVGPGDTITVTATKVTNVGGWFTVFVMKA